MLSQRGENDAVPVSPVSVLSARPVQRYLTRSEFASAEISNIDTPGCWIHTSVTGSLASVQSRQFCTYLPEPLCHRFVI